MDCPYCSYNDSKVIDSREVNDGVRRRRQCLECGRRFTTYERPHLGSLFVIKKDQRREAFSQEKLLAGIRKACEKRPLPSGAVERLADEVEAELYRMGKPEVPTVLIGDMVMDRLKKLDYIAYIRFASVYRDCDIITLKKLVDMLAGEPETAPAPPTNQLTLLPAEGPVPAGKATSGNRARARFKKVS